MNIIQLLSTLLPIIIVVLLICTVVFKIRTEKKHSRRKYVSKRYHTNKKLDAPVENEYDKAVDYDHSVQDRFIAKKFDEPIENEYDEYDEIADYDYRVQDRFIAKKLMTDNEREFYQRLKTALPKANIFPQVAMSAILKTENPHSGLRNKFAQKVIDYVVTDDNFRIITIIELDDRTHKKEKDRERDDMLESAGYRVIRYQSREKPTPEIIRQDVENYSENLICPLCNSKLIFRRHNNDKSEYWGCSNYHQTGCKGHKIIHKK